ncbi:hypothetical protein ACWET9_03910 [Streptomyces sp. NPDC004059]
MAAAPQADLWTPGTFAVEHADSPVRPGDVAVAVRRALREGWYPMSPGSSFHLDGGGG